MGAELGGVCIEIDSNSISFYLSLAFFVSHIARLFLSLDTEAGRRYTTRQHGTPVYSHSLTVIQTNDILHHSLTQATNTTNVILVSAAVKETILQNEFRGRSGS